MSQNIAQLKALLFDGEARAIADLSRRVEQLAEREQKARVDLASEIKLIVATGNHELRETVDRRARELANASDAHAVDLSQIKEQLGAQKERLDETWQCAGTSEHLEINVAGVIDGVLRRAEVERHTAVADAMAPLVVRTIRTEIRNSQDDIVEAIYPMTGRMVRSYLGSAMRDLMEETNRRLEFNPLMLRLRSLLSGRSVAEIALAESRRLKIEELYLIRRGTGELVTRWPEAPGAANRDQVMSGILAAINDFASEAFKGEGSALRQINLEASQVYLRASPAFLLAVRCTGSAHAAIEQVIDDEFLAALERFHANQGSSSSAPNAMTHGEVLSEVSRRLASRVAEKRAEINRTTIGISPASALALLVLLPLAGWLAWSLTESYQRSRVHEVAQRIIDTNGDVRGYPLSVEVDQWGKAVTLVGLAPTDASREGLVKRVAELLPFVQVRDQLNVLPKAPDARPQLAMVRSEVARLQSDARRTSLRRTLERTRLRLEQAARDLSVLAGVTDDPKSAEMVRGATMQATDIAGELNALQQRLGSLSTVHPEMQPVKEQLEAYSATITSATATIAKIMGADEDSANGEQPGERDMAVEAGEQLMAQSERLGAMTIAAYQNMLAKRKPILTPRERVASWARSNAIFFSNGTDFRNPDRAAATLDAAAALLKETKILIRIVGYTDEQGSVSQNKLLAWQRSEKVMAELAARGVPAAKLILLPKGQGYDVAVSRGPQSPNRRVEFHVGFEGEDAE